MTFHDLQLYSAGRLYKCKTHSDTSAGTKRRDRHMLAAGVGEGCQGPIRYPGGKDWLGKKTEKEVAFLPEPVRSAVRPATGTEETDVSPLVTSSRPLHTTASMKEHDISIQETWRQPQGQNRQAPAQETGLYFPF